MPKNLISKEKLDFLLRHPDIAINYISRHYPFSFSELQKYESFNCWYNISLNHNIEWSFELIDHFADKLDFKCTTSEFFPGFFCLNHGLPWSIDFIKRYEHLWDWNILMYNSKLRRNKDLYSFMEQTYLKYTTEYKRQEAEKKKNSSIGTDYDLYENNHDLFFLLTDLDEKQNEDDVIYTNWEQVEESIDVNWEDISNNIFLPWNEEIIEKYKQMINFRNLCRNISIPWSTKLVSKYLLYFKMFHKEREEKVNNIKFLDTLCLNTKFPWDLESITKFKDIIDFKALSVNIGVDWNFELLDKFKSKWDKEYLYNNRAIVPKAFPELMKFDVMTDVLEEIIESNF